MRKPVSGGRPPKFNEESRPITVTLPQRIIHKLESIDLDRAKAIVKCVDQVVDQTWPNGKMVEVVNLEKDVSLIVVGSCKSLKNIPWLRLIEIAPCRFLLAIPTGTAIESLEVAVMDLIEHMPDDQNEEKDLLIDLREKISHHRRLEGFSKGEILFINTD